MTHRPHRGPCHPPHGHHPIADPMQRRWWLRRAGVRTLRHRIFMWFGFTILVTGSLVAALLHFSGRTPSWRTEYSRGANYLGSLFSQVWDDPSARERLVQTTERELGSRVRLFDASGKNLTPETIGCRRPLETVVRSANGATMGRVELCLVRDRPSDLRLAGTILFALAFVWLAAGFLARRIARPFAHLAETADDFGRGKLEARIDERHTNREARAVAVAFNAMADRIQKQLSDQKALLAAVSHEIRTPLARIRFLLDKFLDSNPSEAKQVEDEIASLTKLVEDLLASSRLELGRDAWKEIDLVDLAVRATEDCDVDPTVLNVVAIKRKVFGDPTLLKLAISNVIENGKRHGHTIEEITISEDGAMLAVEVRDRGPGLTDEDLDHVFQAFYKNPKSQVATKASTGLGLHLVKNIVEAHSGTVSARNASVGGAIFELRIPTKG